MEATVKSESALNASSSMPSGVGEQGHMLQSTQKNRPQSTERPALERITSTAHQAVDKLAYAATQAVETLDEKGKRVRETQTELAESVGNYVKAHPGTSLGIAVASGFLIRHLISLR